MVPFTNAISTKDGNHQTFEKDSYTIGTQAYIYGLAPNYSKDRRSLCHKVRNGALPSESDGYAPSVATPNENDVVAPNADMLYNIA